ncbi:MULTISPECIES: sulfite exporter TauE/SafE family protein [Brevibacillus]|jgi:sulfite exporter TauE/SafE|uniref:sulfite exporter TauE/SafE family protein n=1 Tax=Brevibacillus TaxID=55080 RepID=UPI001C21C1F8|nr:MULTISPECIES: sulfite exporter TauE/SafE family protein [Brevibacillus]MBU8716145.1 sulfite exporter TauE/SafE family protein [Brevibacillus parabrevis]MDH6353357.1 sulfite exporter TauE/SafE [Brevibacillus sp. 1238]MDR5001598.1 sulfite exporter TauE/SafE family protein [Brevibacillus parabrevis]MED2253480.1 sulfite exporter TauE/SafE family protein [Brevibacillus parabrevis]
MNAGLYDYWLVFVTGLLSAPHCIGMCGGIMSTMTLQSKASLAQTILAYNAGRIVTYMAVGAFMGFVGSFVNAAGVVVGLQGIANIAGGLLIILWVVKKVALPLDKYSPLKLPAAQKLLQLQKERQGTVPVLASGLLLGFLPCGLTYTMHMKAAATGSVLQGMTTLGVFGLGTLPALVAIALFSLVLSKAFRSKVMVMGNALALCIGILSVLRGMAINGWIPTVNPWLW